jgi:hypothetical protein
MAPFKSSLAKTAKQLLGLRNTADLGLRGATQNQRTPPPLAAPFTANIVMMGGGGGGGGYQGGGGGGAGGMAIFTFAVTLNTAYPFQVGNGGAASPGYPAGGNVGIYSFFNTDSGQKAGAGGAGGDGAAPSTGLATPAAALGGNGGGAGSLPNAVNSGASGVSASPDPNVFGGNSGGSSSTAGFPQGNTGGGGGGVGGNGTNGRSPGSGDPNGDGGGPGGIGKEAPAPMFPSSFMKGSNFPSTFIGLPVSLPDAGLRTFGGGGGGGAEIGRASEGYGGPGGGGDGANRNRDDISATAGVNGRGAGGGGGGQVIDNPNFGAAGGGGVIYIQYPENVTATISVPSPRGPLANTYTANTGDTNNYAIITADASSTTAGTISFG